MFQLSSTDQPFQRNYIQEVDFSYAYNSEAHQGTWLDQDDKNIAKLLKFAESIGSLESRFFLQFLIYFLKRTLRGRVP